MPQFVFEVYGKCSVCGHRTFKQTSFFSLKSAW